IYMDGRPHPPESASHTWAGFSTGRWEGDMLTIKTTHLKEGYVRRNGLPRSDTATLTEHWIRHGDVLTAATIVYDPVYLTEPFIRTTDYELDLHQQNPPYPCEVVEEVDRPKGAVPHRIPQGDDLFVTDFAKRCGIPVEAAKRGAETMYLEYRAKLPGTPETRVAAPRCPGRPSSCSLRPLRSSRPLHVRSAAVSRSGRPPPRGRSRRTTSRATGCRSSPKTGGGA